MTLTNRAMERERKFAIYTTAFTQLIAPKALIFGWADFHNVCPFVRPSVRPDTFWGPFLDRFYCRLTNRKRILRDTKMEPQTEQKTAYLKNISSFCNRKTCFQTGVANFQNAYQARKWLNFNEIYLFFNALFEGGVDFEKFTNLFLSSKKCSKIMSTYEWKT